MSAAHTPGPWTFAWHHNHDAQITFACVVVGSEVKVIGHGQEQIANARLIAAAPELAATLAAVADFWAGGDAPPELEQRIYAALRAAGVRP